ncbi:MULTISPECIES: hypothetical protein [unclassified Streptomyces]|uniref:hypothetical protein n=1 Tax=unclassified Streptomyces TaxID=2593676 RepID=UPI0019CF63AC|nr:MULTISPECIES: hypothetical protein [unclassified Streptomyces]
MALVLVLAGVAGVAGTAAWQVWKEGEGSDGTRRGVSGGPTPSGTPGRGAPSPSPEHTEAAGPAPRAESAAEVRWALSKDPKQARLGVLECDRPAEGGPSAGSTSTSVPYRSGDSSAEVGLPFTSEGTPRMVTGVKPPGGTGFGHTTRPLRVGPAGRTLEYPRDFPGTPPVTSRSGDWTVVVYRTETDDRTTWKRFGCTGFRAARSGG